MPVFEFKGLNEAGKSVTGLREADSAKGLRALLRKEGVFLTEVVGTAKAPGQKTNGTKRGSSLELRKDIDFKKLARGRINTDDIAIMTRQLSTLLGAGVTLIESLTALVDQVDKERLKRVISEIKQRVNEGSSLADALGAHPKVFGNLYINMVRAGEHSGALDTVLLRLAEFTEGQAQLRQKVMGTMMYPFIMSIFGGGTLIFLMAVIVPQVTKVFKDMKATLPWTTRTLIWSSDLLQGYWFLLVPGAIAAVAVFFWWKRSPGGKAAWDRFVLKVPLFGSLVRNLAVARFTRTLSTLLKSGVPLLAALDIVKNIITNSVLAEVIEKTRDAVREGETIANPIKRSGQFPPLVHHMVAIGERSGQLEDMLVNVASSYEAQVQVRIGALTSMLEPILIVAMGVVIAFVAFSILMPILQINSALR